MIYLTKKQDEFLQTFKNRYGYMPVEQDEQLPEWADNAIHHLIRYGHGYPLEDAYDLTSGAFNHETKTKAIKAIFHSWEIEPEKEYYLYMNFQDNLARSQKLYKTYNDVPSTDKLEARLYLESELPSNLGEWKKEQAK